MDDRLREIEERAAKASDTTLPLVDRGGWPFGFDVDGPDRTDLAGERGMFLREEDALLFAHAKSDLLYLLQQLREAQGQIERLTLDLEFERRAQAAGHDMTEQQARIIVSAAVEATAYIAKHLLRANGLNPDVDLADAIETIDEIMLQAIDNAGFNVRTVSAP